MPDVPEEIVQAAWKEVARLDDAATSSQMARLGATQPDLVAFVSTYLAGLRPPARDLGIYLLAVVLRMFERAHGAAPKRVGAETVFEIYHRNEALLLSLEGAHDLFYDRVARARQPHVMGYVLSALLEFGDAPGDPSLTAEETATLFLVLKAVVDALDLSDRGAGE